MEPQLGQNDYFNETKSFCLHHYSTCFEINGFFFRIKMNNYIDYRLFVYFFYFKIVFSFIFQFLLHIYSAEETIGFKT